jgi:hypothetical protein
MSWCRAQIGTFDQRYYFIFYFFGKLQSYFIWGALSDERSGHVILTTAIKTSETRLSLREITVKYAVESVMKHAEKWNYDTNRG